MVIPPHLIHEIDQAIARRSEVIDGLIEKYRHDVAIDGVTQTFIAMTIGLVGALDRRIAVELLAVAIKRLADQPDFAPSITD